ncbi:MAG: BrnA antitoxin family protein [Gemmatimonadota bacterium]|nr:BrnA antitoxin family protein [Gemmatimonadota bacterium]
MRKEYDFSKARRGSILPVVTGKTRITIRIDDDLLDWFRARVDEAGGGSYQALINQALRQVVEQQGEPLEALVQRVVREELKRPYPKAARKK